MSGERFDKWACNAKGHLSYQHQCSLYGSTHGSTSCFRVAWEQVVVRMEMGQRDLWEQSTLQSAASPINLTVLAEWLLLYPDREVAGYMLESFKVGFRSLFQGIRCPTLASNLKSVRSMEDVVRKKIQKGVVEGIVDGPFVEPAMINLHISPLWVVPKKSPGEFWLIHHLSYPAGESVNDMITQELCMVQYTSFDTAIRMVRSCGNGEELLVHPDDFELLGFQFEGHFYMDKVMPMVCSVSGAAFEHFSLFLNGC